MSVVDHAVVIHLKQWLVEESRNRLDTVMSSLDHEKYLFACGYVKAMKDIEEKIDEAIEILQKG